MRSGSDVEEEHHGRAAARFVLAHDQVAAACGGSPVHVAEVASLATTETGWSEIGFAGLPLDTLHSPLFYDGLARLARWGVSVGPVYCLCLFLGFLTPAVVIHLVARRTLALVPASFLSYVVLVMRPAIVGTESAFGGMWTAMLALSGVLLVLDQIARHGLIDLDIEAQGDLHIDGHHTVEDVGITLGQAMAQAVGDKKGLRRYGHAYVPLDEALSRVVIDFSGRPGLHMRVDFKSGMIGALDTQLVYEFFQGFSNHAGVTLHIDNLHGDNAHHQCETIFKAFARALRMALEIDPRAAGVIPSTKGSL